MASSHLFFLLLGFSLVLIMTNTRLLIEGTPGFSLNLTLVHGAVEAGAVCLDGSPCGYALDPGFGTGCNSWLIYLEGGGWCPTAEECRRSSKGRYGSTKGYWSSVDYRGKIFKGILDHNQTLNPDFYNWNRAYVVYCDGSSFLGDVEEADPQTNVHYRGSRVFDSVMQELLSKGLNNADDVVLTGTSAGGLATILHCDAFRELVPNAGRVKCVADSGFFLHAENLPGAKERVDYYDNVVQLHGLENVLPTSCLSRHTNPGLCLFPENLVQDIQTPLFILESSFDSYQLLVKVAPFFGGGSPEWQNCLNNSLSLCNSTQLEILQEFQGTFVQTLEKLDYCPSLGLFIHTCYRHGHLRESVGWQCSCVVNNTLGNKTIAEAIGDWFFDRTSFQEIDTNVVPRTCSPHLDSDAFYKKCIELTLPR